MIASSKEFTPTPASFATKMPPVSVMPSTHESGFRNNSQRALKPANDQAQSPRSQEKVYIQLYEEAKSSDVCFERRGFDKIIVPFSTLDLEYVIHGNKIRQRLMPGEGMFIPSENTEMFILGAECEEYILIDLCVSLRDSIRGHINKLPPSMLKRATLLDGAQNLLHFAHTARRLLMSPLKNSDAAIEALGVIAVSEAFISVQTCTQRGTNLSRGMIEKIDTHIRNNIDQHLSLNDLAELCQLSMHHFARSFKVATGKTPYQYILDRRVSTARRQLCETDHTIAEIAYEAGFSSQSHMTDLFRKVLGTTPGKYRESHK